MWGQESSSTLRATLYRIIPMRVGTSLICNRVYLFDEDHPHACGDKEVIRLDGLLVIGSSPCVWGQVPPCIRLFERLRIIPMRVGTSVSRLCLASADKDHPHACGDKRSFRKRKFLYSGSSPCVWGQVNTFVTISLPLRIIPMRVGTSVQNVLSSASEEDHPHACGDKPQTRLHI